MKRAILSFDYELFFGDKSGTVQRTLIEPTNIMLNVLDEVGAQATFFVDYLMKKHLRPINIMPIRLAMVDFRCGELVKCWK